jgi:hypothetical protein
MAQTYGSYCLALVTPAAYVVVSLAPGTVAIITASTVAATEATSVALVAVAPVTAAPVTEATLDATTAAAPVVLEYRHGG